MNLARALSTASIVALIAGCSVTPDEPATTDATVDGGAPDLGVVRDGGPSPDASTALDTGVPTDSGEPVPDGGALTPQIVISPSGLDVTAGRSAVLSISLSAIPDGDATIDLVSSDLAVATLSQTRLMFDRSNFAVPQPVTVRASDPTGVCFSRVVTVSVSGVGVLSASVPVRVMPSRMAAIASVSSVAVGEGASVGFDVNLNCNPGSETTVTLTAADASVVLSASTLVFTAANAMVPQSITLTGQHDDDSINGVSMLTMSATGLADRTIPVFISDDDTLDLNLSAPTVMIDEGATRSITVALTAAPPTAVTVAFTSRDPGAVSVTPASLTFSPANWSAAQTLSITGTEDIDVEDEQTTISLTAVGFPARSITVDVRDTDVLTAVTSTGAVVLNEGSQAVFGVILSHRPSSNVTVSVSSSDAGAATVSPASIVFSQANWSTPQPVTIRGVQDADDMNEAVVVSLAIPGGPTVAVNATVNDDEFIRPNAILLSDASATVLEGTTSMVDVRLMAQPGRNITVDMTSGDPGAVSVSPATLVFTPANWSTPRPVMLRAEQDCDVRAETVVVTFSSIASPDAMFVAAVDEDDSPELLLSRTSIDIAEGQSDATTVALSYCPDSDLILYLTSANPAIAAVAPAALTFTPTTWNTAASVDVVGAQDANTTDDMTTISITGGGLMGTVDVVVRDDDVPALEVSTPSLTMAEGAASSFTVALAFQPAADVTVTVVSADDAAASVDRAQIVFTPTSWDMPVTVNVTGEPDCDENNEVVAITLASAAVPSNRVVTTMVVDDDTASLIVSATTVAVDEGGTAELTVAMATCPAAPVAVAVTNPNPGAASVSPTSLTFSMVDFATPQTITVGGVEDADVSNEMVTLVLSAAGVSDVAVLVAVTDDDTLSIRATPSTLNVPEGATATVQLVLTAQPEADVTVSAASSDALRLAPPATPVVFTPTNWNVARTVTLVGLVDCDLVSQQPTITFSSPGVAADTTVAVTVVDADTLAMSVTPTTLALFEGGSGAFDVSLTACPEADITVSIVSSNGDVSTSAANLTFTAQDARTPQMVTVSAMQDADQLNEMATIDLSAPGLAPRSVVVNVTDDDTLAIVTDTTTLMVDEDVQVTLQVWLSAQPSGPVTVSATSQDPGAVTAIPTTLFFSTTDWNMPQTVSVRGVPDCDVRAEATMLVLSSPQTSNDTNISVGVSDDDVAAFVVTPASVTVDEQGTATFTAALSYCPSTDLAVTVASDDAAVATAAPTGLSFSSVDWDMPRTVTVSGTSDADLLDGSTVVRLSAIGLAAAAVPVTVADDDNAIRTSVANVALGESGSATFTVTLARAPATAVTVAVASSDVNAATAGPTMLVFDTGNFAVPQTVTVSGVDDLDVSNESVNITLSAAGMTTVSVVAAVTDDDSVAISTSVSTVMLTEGAQSTVQVTLTSQPQGDVTIALSSSDPTAASVTPASLTFTMGNWNVAQTLTIDAEADCDASDESVMLMLSSVSATDASIGVSVDDAETAAIVVSRTMLEVGEGASATFTVALSYCPVTDVVLMLGDGGSASIDVAPAAITFSPTDWATARTVTVDGAADANTTDESATVTLTAVGLTARMVSVTVRDDDTLAIAVAPGTLVLAEGTAGTVQVSLTAMPAADVVVSLTSSDGAAVGVPAGALTFTPTNWSVMQAATLDALDDCDLNAEAVQVVLTSVGVVDNATVSVSVTDDDVAAIVLANGPVTVAEGTSGTFTAVLSYCPAADVTVVVTPADPLIATATPASLVFGEATWNTPQTVTVNGAQDADTDDETTSIALAISGGPSASAAVSVTDDDNAIIVSTVWLTITEGATATFTVRLARAPAGSLSVAIASPDTGAATVAPTPVVFDAGNFATPRTVTVTGVDDADLTNEAVTLTLSAAGLPDQQVAMAVVDDDVLAIQTSVGAVTVSEGAQLDLQVTLTQQPTGDVTVMAVSADPNGASVSPAMMTFTTANWNIGQTLTVTGESDCDLADEAVSLTLSSVTVANDPVVLTASVDDDDSAGFVLSSSTLSVNEGATADFTAALSYCPTADVVVSVASSDVGAAGAAPAALTFTAGDWNMPQSVTVSGIGDPDAVDESATVTLSATGPGNGTVTVTVVDDDSLSIVSSAAQLAMGEGAQSMLQVSLSAQPQADVTVTVASGDVSALTATPVSMTFTSANWNILQAVTLSAVEDCDLTGEVVTITLASTSVTGDTTVVVTLTDNDTATFALVPATLSVNEGATAGFTVALSYCPDADVAVTVASSDVNAVGISTTGLTFTTANWESPQTITVSGVDDVDTAVENATVSLSATGVTAGSVMVMVVDDDLLSIASDIAMVTVAEGAQATLQVSLSAQPPADLTVTVASSDNALVSASPVALMFTTANWNTPQPVTLAAQEDCDIAADSVTVTLASGAVAGDTTVAVTVTDNDMATFALSTAALSVNELGGGSFTAALSYCPEADVNVTVASSDPNVLGRTPTTLLFTSETWSMPQTVTLSGLDDVDTTDENETITLSANGVSNGSVSVTVVDDDSVSITSDLAMVMLGEQAQSTLQVTLSAQPATTVVVTAMSSDADAVAVTGGPLTFTTNNWNVAQALTLAAQDDCDASAESVMVTLASVSVTGDTTVTVSVTDDDMTAISLSTTMLSVNEGATSPFSATLSYCPVSDVVVTVATSDLAAVGRTPTSLTFTSGNWDVAQTVTVSGVEDADTTNESETITLSAAGVTGATVTVDVMDNDAVVIVSSVTTTTVAEQAQGTLQITLSAQPPADVVVTAVSSDEGALLVTGGPLTFTNGNWNVAQNLTLTAQDDCDIVIESVTVTLGSVAVNGDTTVAVSVTDNDSAGLLLSTTMLAVAEGGMNTFDVRPTYCPAAGDLTVNIASADTGAVTATPSLNFNSTDWSSTKPVTVSGVQDVDSIDETVNVTTTIDGLPATAMQVAVSVADDDEVITPSTGAVTVAEGQMTTFTVVLGGAPAGTVTVTVASSDTGAMTATPVSLVFDAETYDMPQTVTVVGVGDADFIDESASVTLSATNYANVMVAVTVTDDDQPAVQATPDPVTVAEGGSTNVSVVLSAQPPQDVVVTANTPNAAIAVATPATRTFTNANWNVAQTFSISSPADGDADDETVTLTFTSPDASTDTVQVLVLDDENAITASAGTVSLTEGQMTTFTVSMAGALFRTVNVGVASSDTNAVTATPASFTFDQMNMNAMTVTVSGVQDADTNNETEMIALSATGFATVNVGANVTDDDGAVMMSFFVTSRRAEVGGNAVTGGNLGGLAGADAFCLALAQEANATDTRPWRAYLSTPDEDARCRIGAGPWHNANQQLIAMDVDTLHSNPPATAMILDEDGRAWDDGDSTLHDVMTGSRQDGRRFANLAELNPYFTVPDMNFMYPNPAFDYSCNAWTTDGIGNPLADLVNYAVVGHLDWSNQAGGSARWSSSHATACDVSNMVLDEGDARLYCFVGATTSVGINVDMTTLSIDEAAQADLQVTLSAQPAADVTVAVVSSDTGAATVSTASLSFTTMNWNVAQTVTVAGVGDADANDESVMVSLQSDCITSANVAVTVTDDDNGILASAPTLAVTEGANNTFTVTLARAPASAVNVTVLSSDTNAITATPSTLMFDAGNFGMPQTITVTGVQDADLAPESETVTLSATGLADVVVNVSVADDDARMGFFLTSRTVEVGGNAVTGGNLGGVAGADAFCVTLAREVDATDSRTWRAYLSAPGVNARDRIGSGPWLNAGLVQVASSPANLVANPPATNLILDEQGQAWNGGASMRHDVMTGSNMAGNAFANLAEVTPFFTFPDGSFTYPNDGNIFDFSCAGWTTDGPGGAPENLTNWAVVGHADWSNLAGGSASWSTSHVTACDQANMTTDLGDMRVYCFAAN